MELLLLLNVSTHRLARVFVALLLATVSLTAAAQTNCVPVPAGAVGWWRGESSALDEVGGNSGIPVGHTAFGSGRVGRSLVFDGSTDAVQLGSPTNLHLQNFTIEAWIRRTSASAVSYGWGGYGFIFSFGTGGYGLFLNGPGGVPVLTRVGHDQVTASMGITDTNFHHLAVTKSASQVVFYIDGVAYPAPTYNPTFTFSSDATIGAIPASLDCSFLGAIDELAIYNRPLSAGEIQALVVAGSAGKCVVPTAPFITTQPASQAVMAGAEVTFNVLAGGTAPLSYQWSLNDADLPGATNAVLALANIQANQAGNYAVLVSNAVGFVLSSNALLTVNALPPCTTPPQGITSWWSAEDDALDSVGANVGVLLNQASFAPGKVGQAFAFNGISQLVQIPDAPSLNPTNALTLEAWIYVSAFSANDAVAIIGKDDPYGARQFLLGMGNSTGKWALRAHLGVPGGYQLLNGTTALQTNTWYHAAMTYDGSYLRLFVNGALDGSLAISSPLVVTANPLLIGGHASGPWNFNGRVDELSLYSRALSPSDIQAIYSAAGAGKCVVPMPPFIVSQPTDKTVVLGNNVTFNVAATGTRPLGFQWFCNGTSLASATNSSLTLTGVTTNEVGGYAVLVTNLYGSVLSSNALLTVRDLGPNLADDFDPAIDMPQWSALGGTVLANNYGGAVSGTNSLWFGGSGSRFAITRPLNTTSGGDIRFYLRLASGFSSTWEIADLPGEGVVLEYSINKGTNWVEMGRYDTSSFTNWILIALPVPTAAQASATQFRWRQLSNSGAGYDNWALDDVVIATGPRPPDILAQPQAQTVLVGETTTFNVVASGFAPLGYQWRFNGADLNGATASGLVLTNVQLGDAGSYSVLVSNALGTVSSSNALLTVNAPPPCLPPPASLVSWWRGEANLLDQVGGNAGSNSAAITFVPGKVGQAFNFDGLSSYVTTPAASTLAAQSLTIEAWIFPTDLMTPRPIVEFGAGDGKISPVHFWYTWTGSSAVPGSLYGIVRGTNGTYLQISAASRVLASNQWSHVAFTYDYANRQAFLYVNGVNVASNSTVSPIQPQVNVPINLGYRPVGSGDLWGGRRHRGKLDEVSIYSRALSAAEIQGIYAAGSSGKCVLSVAPFIASQPVSQTVTVGEDVTFSIVAGGTRPMSYQWQLNGSDLAGATNALLTLANVQLSQAGSYAVQISNAGGTLTSSNAVLVVNPPPPCVAPAAGVISWWRAESNSLDQSTSNNGSLLNGASFAPGKVGQAFAFNGINQLVQIPDAPSLNPTNALTLEAWIYVPAIPANDSVAIIGKDDPYGARQFLLGMGNSTGKWALRAHLGVPGGYQLLNGTTALQTNTWYHAAMTYDGSYLRLFVNGALDGSLAISGPLVVTANPLLIGGHASGPWNFNGRVDELSLYSWALSPSEIQAIYAAGSSGKCAAPIAPFITSQPADQTVIAGEDVTFSVTAGGSQPLSYQWQCNGVNLLGATNAVLTLTNVQLSQAGSYAVVVSNLAGTVTSRNALLGVHPPPAAIQVLSANVAAGNTVTLPIRLVANGDENALGFSLSFDPALLSYSGASLGSGASAATLLANTSQAANGKLGLAIALPTDTLFGAGTQEVVQVTFLAAVVTNDTVASIGFADQPIGRQLSDAPGNILAATYAGATVAIAAAEFEGDVSPRPGGNRAVTVTDWVLVGRYAARVDYPTNAGEFQHADCAPRSTLGDGAIKVTDWVQAGRYAAGLDPLTPVGGPTVEAFSGSALLKAAAVRTELNGSSSARQVKVASPVLVQGQDGTVDVTLEAQGDENALGFSLAFDPAALTFAGASLGSAATGAALNINTNQVGSGRVGFVLALGAGNSFVAGAKELVKVSFRASASASGSYSVTFADQPVPREVAAAAASVLSASYLNGAVTVNPALALRITTSGQNITLSWPVWATNCAVQQTSGALSSGAWTNVPVTVEVRNNENTVTLPTGAGAGFYRLSRP